MNQNIKSLLIFRLGSVGDTVVALPSFKLIKKAFPETKLFALTNMPVNHKACALELILENTGLIDHFIEYPSKSSLWQKILGLRKIIKKNHFQTMIYFHQTRSILQAWRDFLFFKLCGIKKIIGLSLLRHGFQYRYHSSIKLYESEHYRLANQLKVLGEINWQDSNLMNLNLTQNEFQKARQVIASIAKQDFIVCSIGTKLNMKDWGQNNWKKLISNLTAIYAQYACIFIGVQDEYQRSEELLKLWTGSTINLCGKLSIRESAAVLSFAKLFIGHDSGPMHLASAVNTTCVAIFSNHAKPGCWYPLGLQHQIIYPTGKTIQSITVDQVVNTISAVLK